MASSQTAIPCDLIRGGSSRGAYFHVDDLPRRKDVRDRVLAAVMGGPDELQVDGLGGGHPLTSKVAVIGPASRPDADVDYLFLQVTPECGRVVDSQNCGNILAGVGTFAVDHALVEGSEPTTAIRVHMVNSGNLCELIVPTPGGKVTCEGEAVIDGVPGKAAPTICNYLDLAGSMTGALLPTGNARDTIQGIEVSCIDNGMPVVLMLAEDLGCTGKESPTELEGNEQLTRQLESMRLEVGELMGLGDVSDMTVPKMCLVSASRSDAMIATRMFIPHACHRSIGVLAAVSVATCCLIERAVGASIAQVPAGEEKTVDIQHPSGSIRIQLEVDVNEPPENMIRRAGIVRTARLLMRGEVYVPNSIWKE